MFKRQLSIAISITLFVTVLMTPGISIGQSTDSSDNAGIRSDIEKLSIERDKKVEIRLRDKTKVKGYLTAVDQNTFNVSEARSGTSRTIAYADVLQVKKSSSSGSSKKWFIFAGVAAAVIVTWIVVKPAVCDGGAQSRGIC